MPPEILAPPPDYTVELPDEEEIGWRLEEAVTIWEPRDEFIQNARDMADGLNDIELPKPKGYQVVGRHTFKLRSIINEKTARFGHLPRVAILPFGASDPAESRAEKVETWTQAALSEIVRAGENFWLPAVEDAYVLGEGVVRVERAPAAFWPDLVPFAMEGEEEAKSHLYRLYEQDPDAYEKAKEEYKQAKGLPLRNVYVPLENFYPVHEGSTLVEAFEIESRSFRSVLSNELFDTEVREFLRRQMVAERVPINQTVSVVRYANQRKYAYYLMTAAARNQVITYPDPRDVTHDSTPGSPILLYEGEHDLGVVPYASVPGRFGGWRSGRNGVERVTRALVHHNETLDQMASQGFTNVRVRYWPTTVTKVDDTKRGQTGGRPQPVETKEGGDITMYVGESVELLFQAQDDPMFQFLWNKTESDMQLLGGSPALFGGHSPGVDTGFQEQLRITQAQSIDDMVEMGLAQGMKNIVSLMFTHAKVMGEKLYASAINHDEKRRFVQHIELDPKWLEPLPQIDVSVERPSPTDLLSNINAAVSITVPQGGNPPLVDLDWAREKLLLIDNPREMSRRVALQEVKQQAMAEGVFMDMVLQKLRLRVAEGTPPVSPNAAGAPQALLGAIDQVAQAGGPAAQAGGISPRVMSDTEDARRRKGGTTLRGGLVPGAPQPAQTRGRIQGIIEQTGIPTVPR